MAEAIAGNKYARSDRIRRSSAFNTNINCFDIAIRLRIDKYEGKFSIDYYEDRLCIDEYEELKNKPHHS